jgi:hypothetical protein
MLVKLSVKKLVCAKHVAQSNSRSVNSFPAAFNAVQESRWIAPAAFFILLTAATRHFFSFDKMGASYTPSLCKERS